jgi:lipoate-protein ligase A
MNMAVDEAVLRARIENIAPNTLRFYCWKPSAVSIGKFQSVENEVRLESCRKHGVDVVRRITGGGAVYHAADDEVTYSVVAGKEGLGAKDIAEVYARIYAGLAEAIEIFGLTADFNEGDAKVCPNLTVNGRKISGSAQSHKKGVVLQHGTLLLKVKLEEMFTFLRVPWAKTCMEIVKIAKHKITSINDEFGKDVSPEEARSALVEGFQKALNVKLVDGKLAACERALAEKLCRGKYATDDWNFHGRGPQ